MLVEEKSRSVETVEKEPPFAIIEAGNATADGLTANAIPKGQEVLIVIGEGLEKERIEVRLKG